MTDDLKGPTGLPFDDVRRLIDGMPDLNDAFMQAATARERLLTKPEGSLGRMEEISRWMSGAQNFHPPKVLEPVVAIFAGNHGVVKQGVSAYPQDVTRQMLENFAAGGAAINQICKANNIGLKIFELALDVPTGDITEEAAMSERDCAATIAFGMEALAAGGDLLCLGEMGIGNTTIAAAVCHGLYGGKASDWVGPGTGVDDEGLARKVDAVERAVALHKDHLDDPLEVLRRLGGRELAAIAGAIIAARHQHVPVLLDGYIVTAAAAVLHAIDPTALDHCMAAHVSAEPAHRAVLDRIGKTPILDLGMRLGEGSGAAMAVAIVRAATLTHSAMATFEQAGVSGKE